MKTNFKELVEGSLKLNEDFTDITGKHQTSDLTDTSAGKEIGRHVNTGESMKVAEAAAHPNAEKWHLEKALEHGKLDHIVAMHPRAPLGMLKRVMGNSADDFARSAAAHNHNMTPRALEMAYEKESSPRVKNEMLHSRHMPVHILNREASDELNKEYPDSEKLKSIENNVNTPHETVGHIQRREKMIGKDYAKPGQKSSAIFKKAASIIAAHGIMGGKSSIGDLHIHHSGDGSTIHIHATHEYTGTPHASYNKNRKSFDEVHGKMDEIANDPYIRQHFDTSVHKISLGKVNSEVAANKKAGTDDYTVPHTHGSSLKLELKPEHE